MPEESSRPRYPWRFGPRLAPGATEFRLWAPRQARVRLAIEGRDPVEMTRLDDGWYEARAGAPPGTRYRFLLEDGTTVPDPASRFQPDGVHGAGFRVAGRSGPRTLERAVVARSVNRFARRFAAT